METIRKIVFQHYHKNSNRKRRKHLEHQDFCNGKIDRHIKWLQVWLLFRSFAQNEEFFKKCKTRELISILLHACQKHFEFMAQKVNIHCGKLRFFACNWKVFNLIRHTKSIGNAINASIREKSQLLTACQSHNVCFVQMYLKINFW